MEVISQTPIASPYVTAPSSPCALSLHTSWHHSAPTSPTKRIGNSFFDAQENLNNSSNSDNDFEFGTSVNFDWIIDQQLGENVEFLLPPTPRMGIAGQLLCHGKAMPLKLPPRLHQFGNKIHSVSQPGSLFKLACVRKKIQKVDSDPFLVALHKVSEDKRGRKINASPDYRRARSHSPFKSTTLELVKPEQVQPKGFIYARWVRDQTKNVENESPNNIAMGMEGGSGSTKIQRIKGLLLKYLSFGRKKNEDSCKGKNEEKMELIRYKAASFCNA